MGPRVYFLDVSSDYIVDQMLEKGPVFADSTDYIHLNKYFGDLLAALATLFESVTGSIKWEDARFVLALGGSYLPRWIILSFIARMSLALFNIDTGVFVEYAVKQANHHREKMIQDFKTAIILQR